MFYYKLYILNSPLDDLTYESEVEQFIGKVVEVKLKNRLVKAIIVSQCEKPNFRCEKLQDLGDGGYPKEYLEIFKFLSIYYSCSFGEVANLFTPWKNDKNDKSHDLNIDIKLSIKQQEAYDFILSNDSSLLFGDTGSGKTEVYMKLFSKMIDEGKSSIFLMPEISLTPQMEIRVKERFGSFVAIWHSKITKKRKQEILDGINSGDIKIIAGARSALFLPLPNLGLIVVDEEHDDSYKSAQKPRYHARDVALYMGKVLGAKVVLGSATPSLTSYHKFATFRLKGTYFKSDKTYIYEECESKLTQSIIDEISKSLKNDKQVIVFLPTRANYKYLSCFECGTFVECPYCSVGMSIHTKRNALVCHYCSYAQKIPTTCPSCKCDSMRVSRIGTAEVVKELSQIYKDKKIAKFDRDEITTQSKLKKVLKEFNDKKIDIMVGTQMLSKGHNYLDVDLAVVLGIDTLLCQPDYRSREKAMSLLLQIAGRSGRMGEGRVLIQTQNREFFDRYLGDYERFLKEELPYRKGIYPPFKKLMKIEVSGKYQDKTKRELENVRECLEGVSGVDVIGAGEAPIAKIASKFRFQVLLRSDLVKELLRAASLCRCSGCQIDIDPVNFS